MRSNQLNLIRFVRFNRILVRPPLSTLNRRASLGSIAARLPAKTNATPVLASRVTVTRANSVDRPSSATATSKVSLVRRAVPGISNRTIGNNVASTKTPTIQQATAVKRATSISRRTLSPAVVLNGTTSTIASIARKTVSTTKLTPLPPKMAKK